MILWIINGSQTSHGLSRSLKTDFIHLKQHFWQVSANSEKFEFSRLFSVSMATAAILKIFKLKISSTLHIQPFCKVSSNLEHF